MFYEICAYGVPLAMIGIGLLLSRLYPPAAIGIPMALLGVVLFFMHLTASVGATELAVPPKGVTVKQMRAAIANHERHKRMTRKQFENMLLSPIGKGRL